ncbi:unannotated protein [freshwater metagenome]|uniref:Unannotated protein n=1 Tax=freshwater metagenome TaxID=449393 RepID=A0A6J7R8Q1_9ZZZZ
MMPMTSSSIGTARTDGISSPPSPPEAVITVLSAANTFITSKTFPNQSMEEPRDGSGHGPKTKGTTKPMSASASASAKPRSMFWRMMPYASG